MDDKLLQSYYHGEVTDEQGRLVTEWLTDDQHMAYYQRLCRLYEIGFWHETPIGVDTVLHKRKFDGRIVWLRMMKVAAIFILGFMLNYGFNRVSQEEPGMQTIYVPAGQNAQLTLADGSKVWLNAGSTLTFPTRFEAGIRKVKLEGEGFFEVKADTRKPFIVSTTHYEVKALGTSFNVNAYTQSDDFETALLTGKVEITDRTNHLLFLTPHTQAVLKKGKLEVVPIQNTDYFLWREGIICFDEPIADVLEKLELYFNVKIEVLNKHILLNERNCTGKFRTRDGLDHILKVLQISNPFTYVKNEEENLITIK